MPVEAMLNSMTYYELLHWLMLESIDPIGPARDDLRHAMVGARLNNLWVSKDKHAFGPEDEKVNAGTFYAKAYERSAKARGLVPEFDRDKFWQKFKLSAVVEKE